MKNQNLKTKLMQTKNIIGIILALFKAFFMSVTQIAWGLVSIFGLSIIINYFVKEGIPYYVNEFFLSCEYFILDNIVPFTLIFFILYAYFEIKEILK